MAKLTIKQQKFIDEYIICGNATEAALKAGYSKKTAGQIGEQNLKKLEIKSAINERLKQLESSKIASAIEILQVLTAVLRQDLTEEVVTLNPVTGEYVTMQKKPSIAEVIKAAGELLKRYPIQEQIEKIKQENELLRLKIETVKGAKPDTHLMEKLLEVIEDGG
ncbi:terminase small subunit [Streptococcus equi subsp. equi]|uniref:terminase small subunit n=3 Tax=Streptococcus equi TaxID=1336 RepID=UPI00109C2F9D|nr:terminase small subunit [Streptococcus equi]MBT1197232.1 terminase small subunit [Streptococcus equi subsp. equi]MCD3371744.1 terminase small subunit [Streptococcus equi subsp. zooepidemicus]HEQ4752432.1 terminase small subunit [Streptococcus pyogenes]MBT1197805.1 terminase small subunit [Streptococcus equi subsp. equi]MBT1197818.1 terminase small subunit [Streptococcus equi subsp. equi]